MYMHANERCMYAYVCKCYMPIKFLTGHEGHKQMMKSLLKNTARIIFPFYKSKFLKEMKLFQININMYLLWIYMYVYAFTHVYRCMYWDLPLQCSWKPHVKTRAFKAVIAAAAPTTNQQMRHQVIKQGKQLAVLCKGTILSQDVHNGTWCRLIHLSRLCRCLLPAYPWISTAAISAYFQNSNKSNITLIDCFVFPFGGLTCICTSEYNVLFNMVIDSFYFSPHLT